MHQSRLAAGGTFKRGSDGLGAGRLFVSVVGGRVLSRPPRQHVDDSVLDERREHEHETDDHPDVDRLDVGHPRQRRPSTAAHRRRRQHGQQTLTRVTDTRAAGLRGWSSSPGWSCGQHGQQTERDTRRTGVDVDPEGHPGQDDDQDRRNVDLNEEVTDVATQYEVNLEARERTCDN